MAEFRKKIIFAGMPDMGYVCLSKLILSGVNITGIIPPKRTDKTYRDFMNFVSHYDIPVIDFKERLDESDFIQKIKDLNADMGVVCSYNHKFPPEILKAVKDGFLNVHPSLLPNYRGPNPYSNVIINNEKVTGVTYHFMDESFDTGDVAAHVHVNIDEDETMGTLFSKLCQVSSECLVELLTIYEQYGSLKREKQPEGEFIYAKNYDLKHKNVYIDWSQLPEDIDRFVRALNPYIGAYTKYKGEYLRINSVKFEKEEHNNAFGTVYPDKNGLKVACRGGYIFITSLQFASYYVSDGFEFIRRTQIKAGEKFDNE